MTPAQVQRARAIVKHWTPDDRWCIKTIAYSESLVAELLEAALAELERLGKLVTKAERKSGNRRNTIGHLYHRLRTAERDANPDTTQHRRKAEAIERKYWEARTRIEQLERDLAAALGSTDDRDDPDLNTCPGCGGPADNGHDRCYPPSPYFCTKCHETRERIAAALARPEP